MKQTLLIAFIFCISLAFSNNQLWAQDGEIASRAPLPEAEYLPDVGIAKKTHPEKIIFSQIKLSDDNPNIDFMAKNSPRVKQAQAIDKSAMEYSEYNRINENYNMHDKNGNIVVHAQLKIDEYSSLQNIIVFDEFDETTFFRFKAYDYYVGVVPEDIIKFSKLSISKPSADHLFSVIGDEKGVIAEFILQPVYADKKEPFMMNDNEYWLMFARIAEFRLWSKESEPQLLWYYRASWHNLEDNNKLNDLYEKPDISHLMNDFNG